MNVAIDHVQQMRPPNGQMHWGGTGWGDLVGMVVFAMLLAIVVLVLVRVLLIPAVSGSDDRHRDGATPDSAVDALRERFARGEIDADEYERRKGVLMGEQS